MMNRNRNLATTTTTTTTNVIFNRTRVAPENSDGWWIR